MLPRSFFPPENALSHSYQPLDITIVFGEGPVKPLLLEEELTSEQKTAWDAFKTDPLGKLEPDFFVIEREMPSDLFDEAHVAYWEKLRSVREDMSLTDEERVKRLKQILLTWQRWGRFSLKRMGKQNAVAAGIALLSGLTKEIIISGGQTMPEWKREEFQHLFRMNFPHVAGLTEEAFEKQFLLYLKYAALWPSEAEIMRDVITHNFSEEYKKRHRREISEVIHLETEAKNTIENITLTINKYGDLLKGTKKVGLLTANHHLHRVAMIAHRFNLVERNDTQLSAQKILQDSASGKDHERVEAALSRYMEGIDPWFKETMKSEMRWLQGLTDPRYITYWFGYTFEIEDPEHITAILKKYQDPAWKEAMTQAFAEVGLDFTSFTMLDLERLAKEDEETYLKLRSRLGELIKPEYRSIPPALY